MFIPLPPGLADLRAYHLETCCSSLEPYSFVPPPGLPPPPGKCLRDLLQDLVLTEPAMIELQGSKENLAKLHPESVATRCSTDEPATPPAGPHVEDLDGVWSTATSAKTAPTQTLEDEEFVQPWSSEFDEAEIEAALEPVLKEMLGQDKGKGKGKEKTQPGSVRWWTRPTSPLLCPLSGFPTCLLPYPPFKLRVDAAKSTPHRLVDGKFLAMTCIVTGRYSACGRELESSDISALDDYIHRCKLGPYRPSRGISLAQQAAHGTPEERETAAQELEKFAEAARNELGKVRRIQENRLVQIKQAFPPHLQAAIRLEALAPSNRRRSSLTSSASTRASMSSESSG